MNTNINRIANGWQVRFKSNSSVGRRQNEVSRYFADSKLGSRNSSLKAARQFRDAYLVGR